jgi:hypothetical protein
VRGCPADDANDGWIALFGEDGSSFDAWKTPGITWALAADTGLNPKNPKALAAKSGKGVVYNGPLGRAANLVSREKFGDVAVHVEFMVPKGSNSGVKLEGVYEIQIADSYGVAKPTGTHCGGIYPRAELLPRYRYIDKGCAPKTNAARPAGEWQTLDIVFHAPRFDEQGKKTASSRFDKVILNGQLIHEDQEVPYPTGNVWRDPEHPTGPLLLQGDHGPVAFRNVRIRPLR